MNYAYFLKFLQINRIAELQKQLVFVFCFGYEKWTEKYSDAQENKTKGKNLNFL